MVRKTEGIREWHNCLELFLTRSKTAEETKMESTEQFWDRAVKNEDTKSKDNLGEMFHLFMIERHLISGM